MLELEPEFRGAGAPATAQRLLQAAAPAENEPQAAWGSRPSARAASALRWFTAAVLGLGVTVGYTVGLCLIPFCKTAVLLIAMMSVFGVAVGVLGGNVLIFALWGDKGVPHMQALHFSFALGAFLAPLLAKLGLGTNTSGIITQPE